MPFVSTTPATPFTVETDTEHCAPEPVPVRDFKGILLPLGVKL